MNLACSIPSSQQSTKTQSACQVELILYTVIMPVETAKDLIYILSYGFDYELGYINLYGTVRKDLNYGGVTFFFVSQGLPRASVKPQLDDEYYLIIS